MKRLTHTFLLGMFILLFSSQFVSADLITPNTHYVRYSFEITNLDNFPDYSFFYFVYGPGSHLNTTARQLINISELNEPQFYKFSQAKAFAIKKGAFNENLTSNDSRLIDLNFTFGSGKGYISDQNPLVGQKDVLRLVDENGLKLEKVNVIYSYRDGSKEEKPVTDNITPPASKKLGISYQMFYFILPAIALIIVLLILFLRRRK